MIQTRCLTIHANPESRADQEVLDTACEALQTGQLVAFPTETVYGLGALASDGEAVARLYQAKGRPQFNPLIAHCASAHAAFGLGQPTELARELAAAFWPGPMTMILTRQPACPVSQLATAGLDSIAVRVPANPVASQLLARLGAAVVAPSANPSGQLSPSLARHVMAGLSGKIALVLDGGACRDGLESTIIDARHSKPIIIRPGPVTAESLAKAGFTVQSAGPQPDQASQPIAPGQLASHYAPHKPLRLNVTDRRDDEWLIGFGQMAIPTDASLSETGDLTQAAAALFDRLHEADASAKSAIALAPIPASGLGVAINDRLNRAAAPKSGQVK